MLRYLVAALLLAPSPVLAGQVASQFTVGIRIIPSAAVQARSARVGGFVRTTTGTPFRRYIVQEGSGWQIHTTEF